jgi:hypothetical protein
MRITFILSLVIPLLISGCTGEKRSSHIGAWQLISVQKYSGDTLLNSFPRDYSGSDIIIFAEKHLLSVGLFRKDSTITNNYVGATYILKGNRFEETLLYSPNPAMVGKSVRQQFEIKNDTLIKTYPFDENWNLIRSGYTVEKFVRPE